VVLKSTWLLCQHRLEVFRRCARQRLQSCVSIWDNGDIVKLIEELEMQQEVIYEVAMQKGGKYQVIIRRPHAVVGHVSDFRTEAEAEAWVAAQPKLKP
jgi:hypothetical protein